VVGYGSTKLTLLHLYTYYRNVYIDYLTYYSMAGIKIVNKDKKGKTKREYEKEDGRVVKDVDKE